MRLSASIHARVIAAVLSVGVRITEREAEDFVKGAMPGWYSEQLEREEEQREALRLAILQFNPPKELYLEKETADQRAQPNQPWFARYRKREKRNRHR